MVSCARQVWDKEKDTFIDANLVDTRHKQNAKQGFIRGPIPLPWITQAAYLPGKALHIALAIWYVHGLTNQTTFKLSPKATKQFDIARWSLYRGLDQLEQAGLIKSERKRGQAPMITLITELTGDDEQTK